MLHLLSFLFIICQILFHIMLFGALKRQIVFLKWLLNNMLHLGGPLNMAFGEFHFICYVFTVSTSQIRFESIIVCRVINVNWVQSFDGNRVPTFFQRVLDSLFYVQNVEVIQGWAIRDPTLLDTVASEVIVLKSFSVRDNFFCIESCRWVIS